MKSIKDVIYIINYYNLDIKINMQDCNSPKYIVNCIVWHFNHVYVGHKDVIINNLFLYRQSLLDCLDSTIRWTTIYSSVDGIEILL